MRRRILAFESMSERSFKEWYKLAFHLLVANEWDKVANAVENTDVTYRWLKAQITSVLQTVMDDNFREPIHSSALNLRDRLFSLKIATPDDDTFNKISFWLKNEANGFILKDEEEQLPHRILSCKFALLSSAIVHYDEPKHVGLYFRSHLQQLSYVGEVYEALEGNEKNTDLLADVKRINEAARDYVTTLGVELADWPEFNITQDVLSDTQSHYQPPEIWCFGDYGMGDGQMSYPEKVLIDKEGNFLVLEENVTGMGGIVTIQHVQLFSNRGKFLKCLLKRGEGKVNGMRDICLSKGGDLAVVDTDDQDKSRVQIFDYEGNVQLKITPGIQGDECIPPRFTSIALDPVDGQIIVADTANQSVHVFSPNGKLQCQFGKFHGINTVSCDAAGKIYIMDSSANQVQVFDVAGNYLSQFSSPIVPRYLLFDPKNDHIYGSDYLNHKVQVYSQDGSLLREHGSSLGTGLNECWFPYGLALLQDGRVAIAERENHRIKVIKI